MLGWGGTMWFVMDVVPQLWQLVHGREPDWISPLWRLPMWLLLGYGWGVCTKRWMNKPGTTPKAPSG